MVSYKRGHAMFVPLSAVRSRRVPDSAHKRIGWRKHPEEIALLLQIADGTKTFDDLAKAINLSAYTTKSIVYQLRRHGHDVPVKSSVKPSPFAARIDAVVKERESGLSFVRIGQMFGISRHRAQQIYATAMKKRKL